MSETDTIAQAASSTVQSMVNKPTEPLLAMNPQITKPSMPTLMQPPQQQQFGQAGNEFSTVSGRKRADRQAAIGNITNLVKMGADYVTQRKQRALSMDIERLLEAQQGLAEAQQTGNQEGVQRNTEIINDITRDPKKAKQLEKAFNVSLVGGGKNQKENQAFFSAWQQWQQKQQAGDKTALNPVAQKLMQSQPWRLQLSPEAQAQAAAIKAGLVPKAGEILTATSSIFKDIMTAKTAEGRNDALVKAAQLRADATDRHSLAMIDAANVRVGGQKYAADVRARSALIVAGKVASTWEKRIGAMKDIAGSSQLTKRIYDEGLTYTNELKTITADSAKAQAELDKLTKILGIPIHNIDSPQAKILRQRIDTNNMRMQMIQSSLNGLDQRMQLLNKLGLDLNQGDSNTGNTDSGGEPTEVPDSDVPEE